jgi:uncharacterized DUF497 family protein
MQFNFEWDPQKAAANARRHGVSFERASTVFRDPHAKSIFDVDHSTTGEDRWLTLGVSSTGALLVVHHTFAEIDADTAIVRIISSRKATRREQRQYME